MLEAIFGSRNKERILFYLVARKEGYAREIARYFETELSPIQLQLNNLEKAGIIFSHEVGKTKVFCLNPRYPFIKELTALISSAINFLPEDEKNKLLIYRKRPRRSNKPL